MVEGYLNLNVDDVYALGGKLEVRPPYQSNFCYEKPQQVAVIDSVPHKYPLGLMYFCLKDNGTYECLDGQQRIIILCEFTKNATIIKIDGNSQNWNSLTKQYPEIINAFLEHPSEGHL